MKNSLKQIKVYDIRKEIEETDFNLGKTLTTYQDHQLAIVEGPKGIFIFDDEACGRVFKSKEEKYTIHVKEKSDNPFDFSFPTGTVKPTIAMITNSKYVEEMSIRDFVRQFGSRLEGNFYGALEVLKEIGLNPNDYYTEEKVH